MISQISQNFFRKGHIGVHTVAGQDIVHTQCGPRFFVAVMLIFALWLCAVRRM